MLRIGIVGKKRFESYYEAIQKIETMQFVGAFDPSFQFEAPKNISPEQIFYSFSKLLETTHAVVFSSAEKIYLPLIELALKNSKPVFLHGVHNLTLEEQNGILKLQDESREVVQIQQPLLYHSEFIKKLSHTVTPLLWQFSYSANDIPNLLMQTRSMIAATLPKIKSNIRKTTVNLFSSCNEIPDIYKVRIDFDNGCVADILANRVECDSELMLKCYEYNKFTKVNLNNIGPCNDSYQAHYKNTLSAQLGSFYKNISCMKSPISSLENEIRTQQIIELVKQKLRININFF